MSEVKNNRTQKRFELEITEDTTAFIDYEDIDGKTVALVHTEVPPEAQGKGVGQELVKGSLDLLADQGKRVVPRCSFVAAYIKRHPHYRALER